MLDRHARFALRLAPVGMVAGLVVGASAAAAPLEARQDGEARIVGLDAEVVIERDALGVPTIKAQTLLDAIRAQGFLHAQERFFQMDLSRRFSSGRLAELAGPFAVGLDRQHRVYGFRTLADAVVALMPPEHLAMLEAYAAGVNAGLADLETLPPEYGVLQATAEPWTPRDSVLVMATMAMNLNGTDDREVSRGVARDHLPPALFDFLRFDGAALEAPLLPEGANEAGDEPEIPGETIVDLRNTTVTLTALADDVMPELALGSNNWAVAGTRTLHGGAIVANDPHLELTLPGVWYRVQMEWPGERMTGASLPGSPSVLIGSTDHVAWGFTNTTADFRDFVVLELRAGNKGEYRVPEGGYESIRTIEDPILVRGGNVVPFSVQTTRWGPIVGTDHLGRPLALRWTMLDPEAVNFRVLDMHAARSVEDAVEIGAEWYGPSQNLMAGDAAGRIGWVVTGWLPRREGFDGTVPTAHLNGVRWNGAHEERDRPSLVDPVDGILWTANNRTVERRWARMLGNEWAPGVRATRIRDLLEERKVHDETSLLEIQLDNRLEALELYRDLALRGAPSEIEAGSRLGMAYDRLRAWGGTAGADEPGLVIVDRFRRTVQKALLEALLARPRAAWGDFEIAAMWREEPLRMVLRTQPPHLLPAPFESWNDFFRAALETVVGETAPRRGLDQVMLAWGDVNQARIQHPLAMLRLGPEGMDPDPLPGHVEAVRVLTPRFGASLRMVASPGHADRAVFHMPCGQSGLWDSTHFRDQHPYWLAGAPTPLLAGEAETTFRLRP